MSSNLPPVVPPVSAPPGGLSLSGGVQARCLNCARFGLLVIPLAALAVILAVWHTWRERCARYREMERQIAETDYTMSYAWPWGDDSVIDVRGVQAHG